MNLQPYEHGETRCRQGYTANEPLEVLQQHPQKKCDFSPIYLSLIVSLTFSFHAWLNVHQRLSFVLTVCSHKRCTMRLERY